MKRNDGPWRLAANDEDNKPVHAEGEKRFEELVLGDWFHLENMEKHKWWIRVGDAEIRVDFRVKGGPRVDVIRGAYGEVCGENREHTSPADE